VILLLVTRDLVPAVKNGPPGMWRALSSPAHLAPHSTWLLLALAAAVALVAWALSRALRRRVHRTGEPAQVIDLAGRRRSAKGRRRFDSR
jgi:hypothetical protein